MEYLHEYSKLTPQEQRQLKYKRQYKLDAPEWDDSMVVLRDAVARCVADGAMVLDLGCGHGNFVLDELPSKWSKKIGIDINAETTAGNTSCDEIVHGDIHQLPFPDNHFDAVVSLWVFEHVSEPEIVFKEVQRVLRPGGHFALVTPNKHSFLIGVRRLLSKRVADRLLNYFYGREDDDVFDVFYRANTKQQLTALAAGAGLSIVTLKENVDPTYTSFNALTYRLSSVASKLPLTLVRPHLIGVFKK